MNNRDWNPDEPEMMDRPQPVSAELERDLENLRGLNKHFGSYSLVRHFLKRWVNGTAEKRDRYRVLDLCTGYGDIPRMMVQWARSRGILLAIDAVDFHPSTLEIARRQSADFPEIRYIQDDARFLGLNSDTVSSAGSAGAYDMVFCSLALHHFSEEDAVSILKRCLAQARLGGHVLVADLERGWVTTLAVWLVTHTLYRDAMTQFDARLSARRAFSFAEFANLAKQAGWGEFGLARFPLTRQALWKTVL